MGGVGEVVGRQRVAQVTDRAMGRRWRGARVRQGWHVFDMNDSRRGDEKVRERST